MTSDGGRFEGDWNLLHCLLVSLLVLYSFVCLYNDPRMVQFPSDW